MCLGAVLSVGNAVCHFVAYRNRTGRVTFLQTTMPALTYGCFNYITTHKEMYYAQQFKEILLKEKHNDDDYETEDYLSIRESAIQGIYGL